MDSSSDRFMFQGAACHLMEEHRALEKNKRNVTHARYMVQSIYLKLKLTYTVDSV
jgi:hypothetical protein